MSHIFSQKQLTEIIQHNEWVIGAVNYDEDLHFSSYYLRASLTSTTKGIYSGYTHLLSFYQGFNERYYLLKNECVQNAQEIISNAENNIGWLSSILLKIREHCQLLWTIFDESEDIDQFQMLSDDELLKQYLRHDKTHKELYKWARLPEALDRGVSYFSNYLGNLTRNATGDKQNWHETFHKLIQPVTPSVLSDSLDELMDIANIIQSNYTLKNFIISSPRRARMLMPADLVLLVRSYYDKWKYLNYHGYGARDLGNIANIMERIARTLEVAVDSSQKINFIRTQLEVRRDERDQLLDSLGFQSKHRQFFELYPEIGAVKLLRRYVQLRNFFYLDLLLAEIAHRLKTTEWQIRNMLPEEIVEALQSGIILDEMKQRNEGCVYCVINGKSKVITGTQVRKMLHSLEIKTNFHRDRKILKGVVACQGKVTGTCKVVIRAGESAENQFQPGDVLASHSTDPDLLNLLKIAGAVVTEQGGVTSHASLICRELGVPAIVGIPGLLDHVTDGDTLEVDAHNGIVKIIEASDETPSAIISFINAHENEIGGKASGLLTLISFGCRVPEFILLNTEKVREILGSNSLLEIDYVKDWVKKRLKIENSDKIVVRSSSIEEDTVKTSSAGRFESYLDVSLDKLTETLKEFLIVNDSRASNNYTGSIIIERMIFADYSGVCLTKDYHLENNNVFVIETMPGSNVLITQGKIRPSRFIVNRETREVYTEKSQDFEINMETIDIWAIIDICSRIEEYFGCPVDVEWACINNKLYILQARPIAQPLNVNIDVDSF